MTDSTLPTDERTLYRAVSARDRRFDGRFVFAVTSTGIYCRPSCPARTPLRTNIRYFAVPAAAVAGGFRACKRCRPDALPGSRLWDHRADLAARALQLVGSGLVDEAGVAGLAERLSVSERHLHRTLIQEVGVGPLALARTRRAQTARMLLEQTDLSVTDVAFAAGFSSVRQFNDVMRAEFGSSPSALRRSKVAPDRPADVGQLVLRLAAREPFDGERILGFLGSRAIPGIETTQGSYRRSLRTAAGVAVASVITQPSSIRVELRLSQLAAVRPAVAQLRRMFDLDADAVAIEASLHGDDLLARLVQRRPGLRVPGGASGFEIAVRAVVGQQISVAGARTILGRIVARCGEELALGADQELTRALPTPEQLATADLTGIGLTSRRVETLRCLAQSVADGGVDLEPGCDRSDVRRALLAIPGVGPWTVEYLAMRALADPDAFPATDLVLQRRVQALRLDPERWRPWRAYAAMHLWTEHAEENS